MKKQRDKIGVWQRALSLSVVLVLALSSCTKELVLSTPHGDGMEVQVTFAMSVVARATTGGTDTGSENENRLDRVTFFVFNKDGSMLETLLSVDLSDRNTLLNFVHPKWKSENKLAVRPIISMLQPKKIYVVANWDVPVLDKATYTETMLKAAITTISTVADINEQRAYPMLMSGSTSETNPMATTVAVAMERQAAKITALLTIPVDVQNRMANIEWQIDKVTIAVVDVPNKSYVIAAAASPTGMSLLNTVAISVNDTKPTVTDQQVPAKMDLKWRESVYINENPVSGISPAHPTYIVVQMPYKNRTTNTINYDNYYKLLVNDTRDTSSPHKVLRNTIYNFNINIVGMGLPINTLTPNVNIDNILTVNSWDKGESIDVDNTPTNFFNIDRSHIRFQPSQSLHKSVIVTNVKNWKLIKQDGTTMFSFAQGKITAVAIDEITYILSGNASVATITVSKAVDFIGFPSQKMFFIAKNLKVPFTVAYDSAVIPN